MPLPPIADLCDFLDIGEFDLCATFPGGVEICAQVEAFPPSLLQLARSFLGDISSALAPLQPIFNIIEAIVAIQQCIEAIPDTIGPPPDPAALADCIPNLIEKIQKLLALLPPASILQLIVDLLDVLIAMVNGVIRELNAIINLVQRITASKAIPSDFLSAAIDCAETTVANSMSNIERLFASLNAIIGLLNLLLGLAGLDEIPDFSQALGDDPEAALEPLEDLVRLFEDFRDAIPL